jgi:hypothetical protein
MKNLYLACLLLLIHSSLCFAQSSIHRCDVSITDFNIDDKIKLGSFTAQVKAENLVTRAFRFPDTKLFVTAGVLYMQESPYVEGSLPVEMVLTLVLSRKPYSGVEPEWKNKDVITNARAAILLKSFEQAKIETIYLGKPETVTITLECKK